MAILEVREMDLDGARQYTEALGEGVTATRTFLVLTNDPAHTEVEILAATGIPAGASLFPGSSIALCFSRTPTRHKLDKTKWQVVCEYKSILNQQELERAAKPNPLDRATAISGQSRTVMQPVRKLLRTQPYKLWSESAAVWVMGAALNSATDPLDPPIDVPVTEWEIHCSKNVNALPGWFLTYANGVNEADQILTIRGANFTIPKACGKLSNFRFSPEKKENGEGFITIEWDVTIKTSRPLFSTETDKFGPWDEERLDEGMRTYNTTEGKWVNVRDYTKQSITLPIPFDGDGNPINTIGTKIPDTSLWWVAYRPFGPRVDFSVMPWV